MIKNDLIRQITKSFEGCIQKTENSIKCWLACNLQHLLDYAKWDNFLNVIFKVKIADCLASPNETINWQAKKIKQFKVHKKRLIRHLFSAVDKVGR